MAKLTEEQKRARAKNRDKYNRADLKILAPGVMVDKNYKKGKNRALDEALKKIMKDPEMKDSWGIKGSTYI